MVLSKLNIRKLVSQHTRGRYTFQPLWVSDKTKLFAFIMFSLITSASFFLLKGLTEEDLTNYQMQCNKSREGVRLERYYSWSDGLEAALCKHKSRQRFHEVALKRCMRSQKQIHKAFPKASKNQRKRAFNKFQNEHRKLRNILSNQKEGASEFLNYQCPHKIGQDYIEGKLRLAALFQLCLVFCHVTQAPFDWS